MQKIQKLCNENDFFVLFIYLFDFIFFIYFY